MHEGRLLPGEAIHMEALSRQLGISRTPLRDALIHLEAQGFVAIETLAQAFSVTPQTIRRDINTLNESGHLYRYHGGAAAPTRCRGHGAGPGHGRAVSAGYHCEGSSPTASRSRSSRRTLLSRPERTPAPYFR